VRADLAIIQKLVWNRARNQQVGYQHVTRNQNKQSNIVSLFYSQVSTSPGLAPAARTEPGTSPGLLELFPQTVKISGCSGNCWCAFLCCKTL